MAGRETELTVPTLGFLVWHLAQRMIAAMDEALEPLDITHAQYAFLASLYGLGRGEARPSQKEIAALAGLDVMHASKVARTLEAKKLLTRWANPHDSRAFAVELTPKGSRTLAQAFKVVAALDERYSVDLGGPRDREQFRQLLERMLCAKKVPSGRGPTK